MGSGKGRQRRALSSPETITMDHRSIESDWQEKWAAERTWEAQEVVPWPYGNP